MEETEWPCKWQYLPIRCFLLFLIKTYHFLLILIENLDNIIFFPSGSSKSCFLTSFGDLVGHIHRKIKIRFRHIISDIN